MCKDSSYQTKILKTFKCIHFTVSVYLCYSFTCYTSMLISPTPHIQSCLVKRVWVCLWKLWHSANSTTLTECHHFHKQGQSLLRCMLPVTILHCYVLIGTLALLSYSYLKIEIVSFFEGIHSDVVEARHD